MGCKVGLGCSTRKRVRRKCQQVLLTNGVARHLAPPSQVTPNTPSGPSTAHGPAFAHKGQAPPRATLGMRGLGDRPGGQGPVRSSLLGSKDLELCLAALCTHFLPFCCWHQSAHFTQVFGSFPSIAVQPT